MRVSRASRVLFPTASGMRGLMLIATRVREHNPEALFVLDLGSSGEPVVEGVPTCLIDHHRPEGVPQGRCLLAPTLEPCTEHQFDGVRSVSRADGRPD
ncbi:MAG: hypothetical protein WKF84_29330 [Pyrinomonadaceae bacterium]